MKKKSIWIIVGVIGASLITVLGISIPILIVPPIVPDEWLTCTPEEQGMNSSKIEDMYDYIYENSINLHSVLIIRNGCIVDENFLENSIRREENYYAPNWMVSGGRHRVYSATKSIISLLIGIAIEMGYIDNLSQTLYEFFEDYWNPQIDVRKKNITIKHLLMQTSGLPYEAVDEPYIKKSLDEPLSFDPGTDWLYSGFAGCHLLSAIINITTGMKTTEFAREYLFEPVGISQDDWEWVEDYQGIANGGNGISFTPRAMAKIGLLCLNNGSWDGIQVVPKEWINESISTVSGFFEPQGPLGDYGYLWWLFPDYYWAKGWNGQCIVVIPEYDIVVIFTADHTFAKLCYMAPFIYILDSFIIGGII
ncbi:MAG: serine hydrolase domain-containing protein [Promethearchaeota archaeon]